jgi:hypothetical protein
MVGMSCWFWPPSWGVGYLSCGKGVHPVYCFPGPSLWSLGGGEAGFHLERKVWLPQWGNLWETRCVHCTFTRPSLSAFWDWEMSNRTRCIFCGWTVGHDGKLRVTVGRPWAAHAKRGTSPVSCPGRPFLYPWRLPLKVLQGNGVWIGLRRCIWEVSTHTWTYPPEGWQL